MARGLIWFACALACLSVIGVDLARANTLSQIFGNSQATCQGLLSGNIDLISDSLADARMSMIGQFWKAKFQERGWEFGELKITHYSKFVVTPQGVASDGVSYNPNEKTVLLDRNFFRDRVALFGPGNDALLTFFLSHEIGHHIQNVRGILLRVLMGANTPELYNYFWNRIENQADCLAGVFFHYLWRQGLVSADQIADVRIRIQYSGDDAQLLFRLKNGLGNQNMGHPHGNSQERLRWFDTGLNAGDMNVCEPFAQHVLI